METFGERLKSLRVDAGLCQQQLAEAIGITRSGYQMIENGRNGKKLAYLPRIAKTLGCQIDDLFPEMDAPEAEASISVDKTVCADGFEDETMEGWAE